MEGREELVFNRLYFKESTHNNGGRCFIAKLKYDPRTGEALKGSTLIVLSNTEGNLKSPISIEGRWDVKCIEMRSKKGWIVIDAEYTQDRVAINTDGHKVKVLINGVEENLRTKNRLSVPLRFDLEKMTDSKRTLNNIREKFKHLQLPNTFDFSEFEKDFLSHCDKIVKEGREHKKEIKKRIIKEGSHNITNTQVQKWKAKWGSK